MKPHYFDLKYSFAAGHEGTLKIVFKIQVVVAFLLLLLLFVPQPCKKSVIVNVPVLL